MDADRFGVLYDRYATKVFQKCLGMTRDRDLAKDLTHDIFLKAFVNLPKFDHRSRFGTWLYSITYNYCLDQLRKAQRRRSEDLDEEVEASTYDTDAYEAELLSMRAEHLEVVLAGISADERALLLMKYQDDLSVKEIMEMMSLGESAVKMRIDARPRARIGEVPRTLSG
ncbi:MAG: RNA polymerase sigma factor [Flavobacteriales bacterium]